MKGQIYKIHNPVNKNTYIGSTTQKYAKQRLYRHQKVNKECCRYGCLFDNPINFEVLVKVDVNKVSELRELEQVFINIAENSEDICVNNNMSYVPDHLKKDRAYKQRMKYNHTEKGRDRRKWQNFRHTRRKLINQEILEYFSKSPVQSGQGKTTKNNKKK
tara:strand:- start:1481 stop:1960 length:480 start_codon:yes stop_codon:yes gene_type:complete